MKQKTIIAILAILLVLTLGWVTFYFGSAYYYNKGYSNGIYYTAITGKLPYFDSSTNQTEEIDLQTYWQTRCSNYIDSQKSSNVNKS